jgi:PPOX class probable F420-dependent enzyme
LRDKACPVVATVQPDGGPQLSAVWAKLDGDGLVFSTLASRQKGRNLARDPRVAVLVSDPADPYRTVEVRGRAQVIPDPTGALIKELGRHYNDGAEFSEPVERMQQRIVVRVPVEHVTTYGFD